MSNKIASAGNTGKKIRSDCFVTLELKNSGGIVIDMKSKVSVMYGAENEKLCRDILKFYEIENALLTVEDKGALPLVIAARIEAVVKELIDTDQEYLLDFLALSTLCRSRQRRRRRLWQKQSRSSNRRIHQQNAREGHQLSLSARQALAAFADRQVDT